MLSVRSVCDLNRTLLANICRLDRRKFDVVVGIPRSGMIPASIMATQLQLPLSDVESYARGIVYERSGRPSAAKGRVLLVDDTVNHGTAMARAVARIEHKTTEVTRFCVYGPYRGIEGLVDVVCETVQGPRAFEWNLWKHARLNRWCLDFDGVLCRDPTNQENDDGPRYERFIRKAPPLHLPKRPVAHIVTGRLEKYREGCEDWLRKHGVEFGQLHMMPYADKAERMAAGGRGQWKAEIMRNTDAEFFIESCPKQASIIAKYGGRPVWCTRTQSLA